MNRKEQIEKQITQLTKELKEFEAMQDEFKNGDYIIRTWPSGNKTLGKADGDYFLSMEYYPHEGWVNYGERYGDLDGYYGIPYYKATPSEIESALRKEWERRCIEAGWDSGDEAEIEAHADGGDNSICYGCYQPLYSDGSDILYNRYGRVYQQGRWATPTPGKKAVTINGYEAEFCDGFVKFGCAKIANSLFEDLHHLIKSTDNQSIGNRNVESVKIGDGTFTADDIKAIAVRL